MHQDMLNAIAQADEDEPVHQQVSRRVRYWSDGAIIGSKLFLLQTGALLFGEERMKLKQFGDLGDDQLCSFRQLQLE